MFKMINQQSPVRSRRKCLVGVLQWGDGDQFQWQIKILSRYQDFKILRSGKNASRDKCTLAHWEYTDKSLSLVQIKNVISLANL